MLTTPVKLIMASSGAYQFLVTIGNSNLATNDKAKISMRVNNVWKMSLQVDGKADLGTCHFIVKLNEGDKVWVMSVTHDPNYFYGLVYLLLRPSDPRWEFLGTE